MLLFNVSINKTIFVLNLHLTIWFLEQSAALTIKNCRAVLCVTKPESLADKKGLNSKHGRFETLDLGARMPSPVQEKAVAT